MKQLVHERQSKSISQVVRKSMPVRYGSALALAACRYVWLHFALYVRAPKTPWICAAAMLESAGNTAEPKSLGVVPFRQTRQITD